MRQIQSNRIQSKAMQMNTIKSNSLPSCQRSVEKPQSNLQVVVEELTMFWL